MSLDIIIGPYGRMFYDLPVRIHVLFGCSKVRPLYVCLLICPQMCTNNGGECIMMVNGYYVEMGLCTVFGFIWYGVFRNILIDLQTKLICSSQRSAQVDIKNPSTEQSKPIDSVYCITVTR